MADRSSTPPRRRRRATGSPLTITAVGDRLIITGDDPKAVALAHDLARLIVSGKGEGYQVFRLQNANAVEVARVLNEWFNPHACSNSRVATRTPSPVHTRLAAAAAREFGRQPAARRAGEATRPHRRRAVEQLAPGPGQRRST